MSESEITCQELVEIITDYLEGKLPAAERARFDVHLANCDGCRTYLDQMRQTIRLVGSLSEEDLSNPSRTKLLDVFRGWKRSSPQD
jgi:anti-sigma factor RsiW